MSRSARVLSWPPALVLATLLATLVACAQHDDSGSVCTNPRRIAALPDQIDEASGLAISHRHAGILWVHNDSGEPLVFALDTLGTLEATIRIDGAENDDWEDIAVAPCGDRSCLYIGAIGDNLHDREDRAVYIVPEPDLTAGRATPIRKVSYRLPDGPQDAEALFVTPDERMYLISKGRTGPITVYAFPMQLADTVTLEPLQTLTRGLVQLPDMVTAAAALPDGRHVLVRTYSAIQLFAFDGGELSAVANTAFDLVSLGEVQGEGADMTPTGATFLVSERSPTNESAILSRVDCRLPER